MDSTLSAMMRQIRSVPALYAEINDMFEQQARSLLTRQEILTLRDVTLTGCGDSYCAAQLGAALLEQFTDLHCACKTSIDLARTDWLERTEDPKQSAWVGISVSGAVTRVAEVMKRARLHHGLSIAVTGNPESLVGTNADRVLHATIPPFEFAPGVRSYCASVLMMTHLAVCWGEVRGTLSRQRAEQLRRAMADLPTQLEQTMEPMLQESLAAARMLQSSRNYEFIGAGTSFHSGWFGMAKILETLGMPGTACNPEDWFHMQYFIKDLSGTSTCLMTYAGSGTRDREEELLFHAKNMGRAVWVVTDREDLTSYPCIHIPALAEPALRPLVECLPLAAVSSDLCDLAQELYMRGAEGPWSPCTDCALVANGTLSIPEEPSAG